MEQEFIINGPDGGSETIILAHGAGAPMDSQFMNGVAEGLAEKQIRVIRFEFSYMKERRKTGSKRPPDPQNRLLETWEAVLHHFREEKRLFIGGKSMGGRMASMIAENTSVQGLVCLGYPFHPPGKPEKTRIEHLESMKIQTLIIQGTRDALGKQEEVLKYPLSPKIALHWLEDGDHSFKPRKSSGRTEEQNVSEAVNAAAQFIKS